MTLVVSLLYMSNMSIFEEFFCNVIRGGVLSIWEEASSTLSIVKSSDGDTSEIGERGCLTTGG